jgi:hypothetical protein
VSASVLDALSRALQLDEAERTYLFNLAHAAQGRPARFVRREGEERVRPSLQWLLDAIDGAAFVRNLRLEVLAANRLGRALYLEMYGASGRPVNTARFVFGDPAAPHFYRDWDDAADQCVAVLHFAAGSEPDDEKLEALVDELLATSEAFRVRWAAHHVDTHHTGVKRFHHPVVGDLSLNFERLDLPADPGL